MVEVVLSIDGSGGSLTAGLAFVCSIGSLCEEPDHRVRCVGEPGWRTPLSPGRRRWRPAPPPQVYVSINNEAAGTMRGAASRRWSREEPSWHTKSSLICCCGLNASVTSREQKQQTLQNPDKSHAAKSRRKCSSLKGWKQIVSHCRFQGETTELSSVRCWTGISTISAACTTDPLYCTIILTRKRIYLVYIYIYIFI